MQEAGHEPPTVTLRPGAVVMTFRLPAAYAPEAPARLSRKVSEGTPLKTPLKTPAALLELFRRQPETTIPDAARLLSKSDSAIKRAVRRLRETGRLKRIGPDKGGHWHVID